MICHVHIENRDLYSLIRSGKILMAGNNKLKIYGKLNCPSGKRMKVANRIFFKNEEEALQTGFRPCGNCMKQAYKDWKNELV
jgi:methylphosphotriester-DNA--protein-cysteine methyltransferase